jgi:hypothetical protein
MDLLEFMEVEASDKSTPSAGTPAGGAAAGLDPGRGPRKRRREQPLPNNPVLATTTTIIITHDTHDTHDKTTTTTTTSTASTTSEELECVAHAAEAAVVVGADGDRALGPESGPPKLVDYPDSEGADEADLDGGDSEATELPDGSGREDDGDDGGGDGGGAKERDARAEEGDEDSEMTQSMDVEELHARVVIPDVATSCLPQRGEEEEETEEEKRGKEERSVEERKNEQDEQADDELGRETAADKHERGEAGGAGAGGEQERRAKGDKAKRRLPDWMVLTPKQLQQVSWPRINRPHDAHAHTHTAHTHSCTYASAVVAHHHRRTGAGREGEGDEGKQGRAPRAGPALLRNHAVQQQQQQHSARVQRLHG